MEGDARMTREAHGSTVVGWRRAYHDPSRSPWSEVVYREAFAQRSHDVDPKTGQRRRTVRSGHPRTSSSPGQTLQPSQPNLRLPSLPQTSSPAPISPARGMIAPTGCNDVSRPCTRVSRPRTAAAHPCTFISRPRTPISHGRKCVIPQRRIMPPHRELASQRWIAVRSSSIRIPASDRASVPPCFAASSE